MSTEPGSRSRLAFRPPPAPGEAGEPGDAPLRLDPVRDGLLYIPDTANAAAPVLVFFHGAGGTGRRELRVVMAAAGRCDADFGRLAAGGVSDGASYALSIGLTNGDLFEAVIAFSPGFIAPGELIGRPRIFVSHGVTDPILPIDGCSRRIVPLLKEAGYDVTYREFDGGHTVPPTVSDEALRWWVT